MKDNNMGADTVERPKMDADMGNGPAAAAKGMQDMAAGMGDRMRDAGDAMKQTGERMADTGAALGIKMLDQAESNAREAFAAMRAAAQAKDVADVVRIQGEYLREQTNRSMSQAREIAEMITGFGRDAIGQMTASQR